MTRYSLPSLLRNVASGHERWPAAWRSPAPRARYQVVVVGNGAEALATAYHLARDHAVGEVAVAVPGRVGEDEPPLALIHGFTGAEAAPVHARALTAWPGLARRLNFDPLFSVRGGLLVGHDDDQVAEVRRCWLAGHRAGVEGHWLEGRRLAQGLPAPLARDGAWAPVVAAAQDGVGLGRADALAWAYAHAADALGVDLLQDCRLSGLEIARGRVQAVVTDRGTFRARQVVVAGGAAGHALLAGAGLEPPLDLGWREILVTQPMAPMLDPVILSVSGLRVVQADGGELVVDGAGPVARLAAGAAALLPPAAALAVVRRYRVPVSISQDAVPMLGRFGLPNLFVSAGWGMDAAAVAPAVGALLAGWVATDAAPPAVAALSPEIREQAA